MKDNFMKYVTKLKYNRKIRNFSINLASNINIHQTMRIPEAFIFDMDGVLVDSEPIHYEIEKILFQKLGINVSEALHHTYLGTSNDFMYSDLKKRFNPPESVCDLLMIDELFRYEYFNNLEAISINEGVISLLKEIKKSGYKLAVATSSSPAIANILLNRCEVFSYFDAIVTTNEAGKSKPAPDVYILAAQKIEVKPSGCIVFEDSPNGLKAAKEAGMYCVAIQPNSEFIKELADADFLIRSFREITFADLIEKFSISS